MGILSIYGINIDKILQLDKIDGLFDIIFFTSNIRDDALNNLREELQAIEAELISIIPFLGE